MTKIAVIYIHKNSKHRVFTGNFMPLALHHSTTHHKWAKVQQFAWYQHTIILNALFCEGKVLEAYASTRYDVQRWIYDSVILASYRPSKGDKGGFAFASFARITAGKDDTTVYRALGIITCCQTRFLHSAIAE